MGAGRSAWEPVLVVVSDAVGAFLPGWGFAWTAAIYYFLEKGCELQDSSSPAPCPKPGFHLVLNCRRSCHAEHARLLSYTCRQLVAMSEVPIQCNSPQKAGAEEKPAVLGLTAEPAF